MNTIQHFVNGNKFSGESKRFGKVFNPATGDQSAEVKLASIKDVNDAVMKYGRMYTLHTIVSSTEDSELKIKLRSKQWFG